MIRAYSLYIAWTVSLVATLISIYVGEIQRMDPCALCWYQRICMYPLAIILGIATYRKDTKIKLYILPQLIIGALFSLWQYLKQKAPYFKITSLCGWQGDCSDGSYMFLGFSLALWSLVTFCFLIVFVWIAKTKIK